MYSSLNIQVNVFLSLNIIPNPFYFNKQEKNNTRMSLMSLSFSFLEQRYKNYTFTINLSTFAVVLAQQ